MREKKGWRRQRAGGYLGHSGSRGRGEADLDSVGAHKRGERHRASQGENTEKCVS